MIDAVLARTLKAQSVTVACSPALKQRICRDGSSQRFGARPLRRTVQRLVEDVLAEALLEGFLVPGDAAELDDHPDGVAVRRAAGGPAADAAGEARAAGVKVVGVAATAGIEDLEADRAQFDAAAAAQTAPRF